MDLLSTMFGFAFFLCTRILSKFHKNLNQHQCRKSVSCRQVPTVLVESKSKPTPMLKIRQLSSLTNYISCVNFYLSQQERHDIFFKLVFLEDYVVLQRCNLHDILPKEPDSVFIQCSIQLSLISFLMFCEWCKLFK